MNKQLTTATSATVATRILTSWRWSVVETNLETNLRLAHLTRAACGTHAGIQKQAHQQQHLVVLRHHPVGSF